MSLITLQAALFFWGMSTLCGFAVLVNFFRAVLRFWPTFRAFFVRFFDFNSSLRFAFSCRILVPFFGFFPFSIGVLRFLSILNIQRVLSAMTIAKTSSIPSVSSFFKYTYDFLGKRITNNKVVLLSILRFSMGFCGFQQHFVQFCGFWDPLRPCPISLLQYYP